MASQIPSYLKLHAPETTPRSIGRPREAGAVQCFWRTFADTTGWAVETERRTARIRLRSTVGASLLASSEEYENGPVISQDAAQRLAEAAAEMATRLAATEQTVRQQAASLAASEIAPAAPDGSSLGKSTRPLADRIAGILQQGVEAAECDSAGLYLLDEQTSELQLRAAYGLPTSMLGDPPRSLRGSAADLEALVGGVVTIDDVVAMPQWHSPEPFGAAICVAIVVGGTPMGTLWMWSGRKRAFTTAHKAAARLTAGLASGELASDTIARRATAAARVVRPLKSAAAWQDRQKPIDSVPAPGWHVAGWTDAAQMLAGCWYTWDVLPDGMLALAVAEAHSPGFDAAMIAATARSAWQSHAGYRHDPAQLLRRVSDTLWQTNTGDQLVSLLYAQINPETGEGCCAAAGQISGIIGGRFGFRPLVEQSQPLGHDIDVRPRLHHVQMTPGETLMLFNAGVVGMDRRDGTCNGMTQHRLAELVRGTADSPLVRTVAAVRREAQASGTSGGRTAASDRVLMAIRRE